MKLYLKFPELEKEIRNYKRSEDFMSVKSKDRFRRVT
jgi:hypothetical protein